jgi:hypothetical protein
LGEQKSKTSDSAHATGSVPAMPQEYGEECGGKGGVPYLSIAQANSRLVRVSVWHRNYVDGIQLETEWGVLPKIGGTGMHRDVKLDTFELGADEFLRGISLEFWQYLDRITFHTNRRDLGPFGGLGGLVKRTLLAPDGRQVVGFKGRHWALVDSIQLMVL